MFFHSVCGHTILKLFYNILSHLSLIFPTYSEAAEYLYQRRNVNTFRPHSVDAEKNQRGAVSLPLKKHAQTQTDWHLTARWNYGVLSSTSTSVTHYTCSAGMETYGSASGEIFYSDLLIQNRSRPVDGGTVLLNLSSLKSHVPDTAIHLSCRH